MKDMTLIKNLAKLQCDHNVIYDFSLRKGQIELEANAVVLTAKAIFFVNLDQFPERFMNDAKLSLIKKVLEGADINISQIPIEQLFVFQKETPEPEDDPADYKMCSLTALSDWIADYSGENFCNFEMIEHITDLLIAAEGAIL